MPLLKTPLTAGTSLVDNQQPSITERNEGSTTSRKAYAQVSGNGENLKTKTCRICGAEKPLDEFYIRKETNKQRTECKDCMIALVKYRTYGVCQVRYDEMLTKQQGKCAICGTEFSKFGSRYNKLSVDHDHKTGKVRGLLCSNCNTAIGLLKDSTHRLEAAIAYLKRHA